MLEVDLFEKVKSGEITSTKEFRVKAIRRGTDDWKKDKTFWALLDLMESGYITGVCVPNDEYGNYESLKVTKKGIKVHKFMKTPIDRLGKPTFMEMCRNGIISAFAGKVVWWLIATAILFTVPSFTEKAEMLLNNVINWLIR